MKWYDIICKAFVKIFFAKFKQDSFEYRKDETNKEADKISLELERKENYIICNGEHVSIEWDNVITFDNIGGLLMPKNCYKKAKNKRTSTMFVTHWDVCLSSKSCYNILKKRKISVHFLIDNDGAIYQTMDCNDIGYHAGNWKVNTKSVGVEISNAYYPKYQNIYRSRGFGPRPIYNNVKVHGKTLEPFLGFYPVQKQAFQALAKALNKAYNIPLKAPMNGDQLSQTIVPEVYKGTFKGVINHYHITKKKIDCAGFKLDEVLEEIT
tara:strand:- start:323 stop:1120 length:798 start_codon:yes stop_codon:yes gene_type:complete